MNSHELDDVEKSKKLARKYRKNNKIIKPLTSPMTIQHETSNVDSAIHLSSPDCKKNVTKMMYI